MTWSGWDVAVLLVGVVQIAAIVGVARAVLAIKNGPVAWGIGWVKPFVHHGNDLKDAGLDVWDANRERALELADAVRDTAESVWEAAHPPALSIDAPINYQKIGQAWTGLQTAQQGVGFLRRVTRRKTSREKNAPFAERIGLIPSAQKPVGKLINAARFALRVRGLLKKGGIS